MTTGLAAPAAVGATVSDEPASAARDPVPPRGFLLGATRAGIKPSGRPDLSLIHIPGGAAVAGVFTRNALPAAPVTLSRRHLLHTAPDGHGGHGWTDAIVSTSGSANAATGNDGLVDQERIANAAAAAVGTVPERTLALSTGLIGTRLPVERVADGIARIARGGLAGTAAAVESVADALMTTDTRRKIAVLDVALPGPDGVPLPVRVWGVAKGVGMMHPRLATMLAVVMTDAVVAPPLLHAILRRAAATTWNQLSVDGDTSTNDTVFLCASGASGALPVESGSDTASVFAAAVESVARSLARQQAADGEGATTLLTCVVRGAADAADARAAARAVVASSLVKAAIHGRDPNWGRVVAALGNARLPEAELLVAAGIELQAATARAGRVVAVAPDRLAIAIAGTPLLAGRALDYDPRLVAQAMDAAEVEIEIDLGVGKGEGEAFGCDLSERYVVENSAYST